jgi:hypothetical protein
MSITCNCCLITIFFLHIWWFRRFFIIFLNLLEKGIIKQLPSAFKNPNDSDNESTSEREGSKNPKKNSLGGLLLSPLIKSFDVVPSNISGFILPSIAPAFLPVSSVDPEANAASLLTSPKLKESNYNSNNNNNSNNNKDDDDNKTNSNSSINIYSAASNSVSLDGSFNLDNQSIKSPPPYAITSFTHSLSPPNSNSPCSSSSSLLSSSYSSGRSLSSAEQETYSPLMYRRCPVASSNPPPEMFHCPINLNTPLILTPNPDSNKNE